MTTIMDPLEECKANLVSYDKSGHKIGWFGKGIDELNTQGTAGVLIPLFLKNNKVHVLLTKRSDNVKTHKGQISFPGGKSELQDENIVQTALRETQEEIGIDPDDIEVISTWPLHLAKAGRKTLIVYPVIGILTPGFKATINEEVSEIFEVPLEFFLLEESHLQHQYKIGRFHLPMHYFSYSQRESSYYIWGLTGNLCLKAAVIALRRLPRFKLSTEVERRDYGSFVERAQRMPQSKI